jgi:hypothetical protein
MKLSRLILFSVLFLAICFVKTSAQDAARPTTPPGNGPEAPAPLPDYVVEVRRNDGCLVGPISPRFKQGYVLYTLPRPSKIPPDSAGNPLTSKVFVMAKPNGQQFDVRVTIGKGEFYDAGDTKVGEFKLNLNERVNVPDVERFGLSPIKVGVVKIVRKDASKPSFRNLTQSISLESLEVNELPDPFKLELKNNANFDVVAVQYNTFARDGFLTVKWLGGPQVSSLIKVGQSYPLKVSSEDKTCGDEEGYQPNQLNRIELVSAVFADGSYEGQVALPALIKGSALGNYNNLERVVNVIHGATDAAELSQLMKSLSEGMNEETQPYMVDMLRSLLSSPVDDTAALNGFIRSGMHEVKVNLMRDSQFLQMVNEKAKPEVVKTFVERIKSRYERWFIAARNITSR